MRQVGNNIDGLPDEAWALLRTVYHTGYHAGYHDGYHAASGKLPFNDDPGSRFELARDEDEDGLDWADRLHALLSSTEAAQLRARATRSGGQGVTMASTLLPPDVQPTDCACVDIGPIAAPLPNPECPVHGPEE